MSEFEYKAPVANPLSFNNSSLMISDDGLTIDTSKGPGAPASVSFDTTHTIPGYTETSGRLSELDRSIYDPLQYNKAVSTIPWTEHISKGLNNFLVTTVGTGAQHISTLSADIIGAAKGDTDTWATMLDTFGGLGTWGKEYMESNIQTDLERDPGSFNPSDPAWWSNVASSGVGSALGIAIPSVVEGVATSLAVGAVTKGVGGLAVGTAKAANMVNTIHKALKVIASTKNAKLAFTGAYAHGRGREALMNGAEIYNTTYNSLKERGISDEEANKLASEAATYMFRRDFITNTALGVLEASMLTYSPLKGKLITDVNRNPIEKIFDKIPNKFVRGGVQSLTGSLIEGEEEGRQAVYGYEAQHNAEIAAGLKTDNNFFTDRLPDYLQRSDVWNQVAGGVMGGAFLPAFGSVAKLGLNKYTGKDKWIKMHSNLMKEVNQGIELEYVKKISEALNDGNTALANNYIAQLSEHKSLNGLLVDRISDADDSLYEAHLNFLEKTLAEATDDTEDHALIRQTYPLLIQNAKKTAEIFEEEVTNETPYHVLIPLVQARLQLDGVNDSIVSNQVFIDNNNKLLNNNKITELGKTIFEIKTSLDSISLVINNLQESLKNVKTNNRNTIRKNILNQIKFLKNKEKILKDLLSVTETEYNGETITKEQREEDNRILGIIGSQNKVRQIELQNLSLEARAKTLENTIIEYRDPENQKKLNQKAAENAVETTKTTDDVDTVIETAKEDPEINIESVEKEAEKQKARITEEDVKTEDPDTDKSVIEKETSVESEEDVDSINDKLSEAAISENENQELLDVLGNIKNLVNDNIVTPETSKKTSEEISKEISEDEYLSMFEKASPVILTPSTEERSTLASLLIQDFIEGMDVENPTFKELIQKAIEISNDKGANIERMYNLFVEGWEKYIFDTTGKKADVNYNTVYNELFKMQVALDKFQRLYEENISEEEKIELQNENLKELNDKKYIETSSGLIPETGNTIESGNVTLAISTGSILEEIVNPITGEIEKRWVEGRTVDPLAVKFSDPDRLNVGTKMIAEVHPEYLSMEIKYSPWKISGHIPTYQEVLDGVMISTIDEEGNILEPSFYQLKEGSDEYWDVVPIVVYEKGKRLEDGSALLHDLNWYNETNVEDDIKRKEGKRNTHALRQLVKKNKSISLEIKEKNTRVLEPSKLDTAITLKEANSFVIGLKIKDELSIYNLETGKRENLEGTTTNVDNFVGDNIIDIRRIGTNEDKTNDYAIGFVFDSKENPSQEVVTSIIKALRLYGSSKNDPTAVKLIKEFEKHSGIDIGSKEGIYQYLKKFIYSPFIKMNGNEIIISAGAKNFKIHQNTFKSYKYNKLAFIIFDSELKPVTNIINNATKNVGILSLQNEDIKQPIFLLDDNFHTIESTEFSSYYDYIINTLKTNLKNYNVGTKENPVWTPSIQPLITVGLPEAQARKEVVTEEEIKPEVEKSLDVKPNIPTVNKQDIVDVEKLTPDEEIITKAYNAINGLYSLDERIGKSLNELLRKEQASPVLGIESIERIKSVLKSIEGITPYELSEITSSFASIYSDIIKNSDVSLDNIKDNIENMILDHIDKIIKPLEENLNELETLNKKGIYSNLNLLLSDYYTFFNKIKQIQDNTNLIADKIIDELVENKVINAIKIKEDDIESEEIDIESEEIDENVTYDKNSEEKDFHEKAGTLVRNLLFNQPDIDTNGNQKTGFLGLPKFVSKDFAFDNTIAVLANMGSNLETMIAELKANASVHPWMWLEDKDVYDEEYVKKQANTLVGRLLADNKDLSKPNNLQSNFSVVMNNHKFLAKFVYLVKNHTYDDHNRIIGTNVSLNVYDSNSSSVAASHMSDWRDNIRKNLTLSNGNDSIFDRKKAQDLLDRFNDFAREKFVSNTDVNSYLEKIGITEHLDDGQEFQINDKILNKLFAETNILFYSKNRNTDKYILEKTKTGYKFKVYTKYDVENKEKYIAWLNDIGIKISSKLLDQFINNTYRVNGKKIPFEDMFYVKENNKGIFGYLAARLKIIANSDTPIKLETSGTFGFADNIIFNIARAEARYTQARMVVSFRDNGKTFYGFVTGSLIYDRINGLKTKAIQDNLSKDVFSRDSDIITLLKESDEFRDRYNLFTIGNNSFKIKGKKVPLKNSMTDLSDADHETTKVGFFQNTSNGILADHPVKITVGDKEYSFQRRIAHMLGLTSSDKTSVKGFITAILNFTNKDFNIENGVVTMNEGIREYLYKQIVNPELQRIINFHQHGKYNIKYNGGIFYQIPQLNDIELDIKGNKIKLIHYLAQKNVDISKIENQIKEKANIVLDNFVKNLVNEKLESWKNNNIIGLFDTKYLSKWSATETKEELYSLIAHDQVINYLIHYSDMLKLYAMDPAFYYKQSNINRKLKITDNTYDLNADIKATYENITKRLARLIAPGQQIANSTDDSYIQLFLDDNEPQASSYQMLLKALGEEGAKNYVKVNETDAQEYTTWQEHIEILYRLGKTPDSAVDFTIQDLEDARKLFSYYKSIDLLTEKERVLVKKVLQPIKPVYSGDKFDEVNGIMRPVYIKSSSFPLIPQLTASLEIDKLRLLMENIQAKKNKNVRASFQSANKVGSARNALNMFSKDGSGKFVYVNDNSNRELTDENLLDTIISEHTLELNRENFRIQQDVPYKSGYHSEDVISNGTQMNKLILANGVLLLDNFEYNDKTIDGKELYTTFNNTFRELLEHRREILLSKFNSIEKLQETINSEAKKNGIQDIAALTLNENGEFANPIWASPNAYRYEALLQSIINKHIIKFKMPGYSYVAGSSAGFHTTSNIHDINQSRIVWIDEPIKKLGHNDILIPSKFRDNKGNLIDLVSDTNKDGTKKYVKLVKNSDGAEYYQLDKDKIDERLLKIISFRIPTSNHSSMSLDNIKGFLPTEVGDLMLVSASKTMQKGLDFDVDKENTYHLWTVKNKEGKLVPLEDVVKIEDINKQLKTAIDKDKIDELNILKEKLINNKMINLYQSILSHEEVQKKTLNILSIDDAKYQANIFDSVISKTSNETLSFISDEYQKQTMISGASGKAGIGVYSSLATFNALIEQIAINNSVNQLSLRKKVSPIGEKAIYEPLEIIIDGITFDNKLGKSILNEESRPIAVVIGERQNISVDNATAGVLGKINLNDYTFGADTTMCLLGLDKGKGAELGGQRIDSISFLILNQPIIRDYVIEMAKILSNTAFFIEDKDKHIKDILLKKYKIKEEDSNVVKTKYKFTSEQLAFAIENHSKEGTTDSFLQKEVLDLFLDLKKFNEAIRTVQSTTSLDSKGVGKSLFDSIDLQEKIDKINGTNKGIYIVKNRTYVLVNNTLPSIYNTYGLQTSLRLWGDYFPYDTDLIKHRMNETIFLSRSGRNLTVEQKQKVFANIKRFFYANKYSGIYNKNETLQTQRKELFIDSDENQSLASYLKDLWSTTELDIIKKNPLFANITFDIKNNGEPSIIKYNNSQHDSLDEQVLHMAFTNLLGVKTITDENGIQSSVVNPVKLPSYNGKEYDTHKLLNDLIRYAYLEGGIQEANQFVKYIPFVLLEETSFASTMRAIHTALLDNNEKIFAINDKINLSNFAIQQAQHNPQDLKQVSISDLVKDDNKIIVIEDLLSIKVNKEWLVKNTEDDMIPEMISMNKNNSYYVFIKNPIKENEYFRIPTLGHSNMTEYDMTVKGIVRSIVNIHTNKVDPFVETLFGEQPVKRSSEEPTIQEKQKEGAIKNEPLAFSTKDHHSILTSIIDHPDISPTIKTIAEVIRTISVSDKNKLNSIILDIADNVTVNGEIVEGKYFALNNTIVLNNQYININGIDGARIYLHEMMHAFLSRELENYTNLEITEDTPLHIRELINIYKVAKKNLKVKKESRSENVFKDIHEFYSELMSDFDLQNQLRKIPYTSQLSLWEKFIKAIKNFFKDDPNYVGDNITDESINVVLSMIKFEKELVTIEPVKEVKEDSSSATTKKEIKNKVISAKGKMTFSYGNNKRNDIISTTTFEAIKNGERTATTRYESDNHIDYWKKLKEGDIIEWESATGEKILVEVTKPLHKLVGSGKNVEQWSKLEGWSTEYFNSKVRPKLNEAWQIEYKLLQNNKPKSGFQGYKGGFENKGKGTPQGDSKDKAMRAVADAFIGESITPISLNINSSLHNFIPKSSTDTSFKEIGIKHGSPTEYGAIEAYRTSGNEDAKIVMLARNSELRGKPLSENTKTDIYHNNINGAEFIVGDMPNVDSQFIDYLQEIGAKFTIYHTGDKPRIKVEESNLETNSANIPITPISEYKKTIEKIDDFLGQAPVVNEYEITPKGTINVYWDKAESSTSTRILSNLAPRKFTWEGREYGSVEHAYQSNKSGTFDKATYDAYNKTPQVSANIPQNKVSGTESYGFLVEANDEVKKLLGNNPHSIDMIEAGLRTRTTRSKSEMDKYAIKVGDTIKHFGKSADGTIKTVYAVVTAIHPKNSKGWKDTWEKEGWGKEYSNIIDRFKDGAAAIEFEIVDNFAYGKKIRGKGTVAEMKAADSLGLMKKLVVESFRQNPNSEAATKLLQYENFTHNTNELIDKAFLEGLQLAQKELNTIGATLESKLKTFFNNFGFKFEEGDSSTDLLHKIIYTSREDSSVFINNSTKAISQLLLANTNIDFRKLESLIEDTSEFKKLLSNSSDYLKTTHKFLKDGNRIPMEEWVSYIKDYNKIKNEVLEKYIKESLLDNNNSTKLHKVINDFLKWFKDLFTNAKNLKEVTDSLIQQVLMNQKEVIINSKDLQNKERVTLAKALEETTHGKDIIKTFGDFGLILTGSISAAEQGSVFRKTGKLLHDIDWVVPKGFRKDFNKKLKDTFPGATLVRQFDSPSYYTQTYIVPPKGYTISNLTFFKPEIYGERKYIASYDVLDKNGNIISNYRRYYDVKESGKVVENREVYNEGLKNVDKNLEAVSVDFFQNKENLKYEPYNISVGEVNVLLSNWLSSFTEKLKYGRAKDLLDYANFIPNNVISSTFQITPQQSIAEIKTEDQVITYTPTGKTTQTYTIKGNQIFNKSGKEVFTKDSKDRNKIFANLAVQEGRAVVVSLKGDNYVVNNKNQIMSVKTGNIMKWEENNGVRQEILTLAAEKFASKNNFASPITSKLWETNKEKLQEAYPTLTKEEFSRESESVQQKIINCI